jgi:hypothetical protein
VSKHERVDVHHPEPSGDRQVVAAERWGYSPATRGPHPLAGDE